MRTDRSTYMKRLGQISLAVCLLLTPFLSGCATATPPPDPVTITFAHANTPGADGYYQQLIAKFNESYPYITVELAQPGTEDLPDVFMADQFSTRYLREEGYILSLDPFIEQDTSFDLSDYYAGAVDLFSADGQLWAIPAGVQIMVMYYNKDVFDQYGVAYPEIGWTRDDFVNALTALSDPSANVYGYGVLLDSLDALAFVVGHGGRFFDDPVNPTRIVFDDPLTVEALEWYADLIHKRGFVATDKQAYAIGGNLYSAVYLNKIAIWPGWISDRGGGGGLNATWIVEWKMRWGMVPFPHDAQPATVTMMAGYFISAQNPSPEACWQWISFLSEQTPHQLTPARRSLAESADFERLVGDEVATVARASLEDATFLSPDLVEVNDDINIFFQMVEHIISGRMTVAEAVAWAEERSAEQD